jgi:NADH:ubiquinone oxidoreductase subunit 3 (subunit A)
MQLCYTLTSIIQTSIMQKNVLQKIFPNIFVIFLVPFIVVFDAIVYFVTKPSCLTCSTLPEFLKTASLTIFLLTSVGYKFRKDKLTYANK